MGSRHSALSDHTLSETQGLGQKASKLWPAHNRRSSFVTTWPCHDLPTFIAINKAQMPRFTVWCTLPRSGLYELFRRRGENIGDGKKYFLVFSFYHLLFHLFSSRTSSFLCNLLTYWSVNLWNSHSEFHNVDKEKKLKKSHLHSADQKYKRGACKEGYLIFWAKYLWLTRGDGMVQMNKIATSI